MKWCLILTSLLMCQLSLAQTMREKELKREMLERVELLIEKVEATREDLRHEDVISACVKIKEMFAIYPKHVDALGKHLDIERGRSVRATNEALRQLIFMHRTSLTCEQGQNAEYLDIKVTAKKLKEIESSLKKQRKAIRKSDTDNENRFNYSYEF